MVGTSNLGSWSGHCTAVGPIFEDLVQVCGLAPEESIEESMGLGKEKSMVPKTLNSSTRWYPPVMFVGL